MNTLSVWKDKIVLDWDGELPSKASASAIHKEDDVKRFWEHCGPYAKWNRRFGAFLLSFSQQNLKRLYKDFGKIVVKKGQHDIDTLKSRLEWFKGMVDLAERVKRGDIAFPVDYKMPPLADYQHKAVLYLSTVQRAPLFADCGVGKSYAVLVSTEHQIKNNVIPRGKTLICGKLATLETGWMEDAAKFTDLKVNMLWTPSQYKRKEKILEALNDPADVYLINHDGVRIYEKELAARNFHKVVVDESTILKGFKGTHKAIKGGQFGRALLNVSHAADWRVIMSGTPAPNGPDDLWGQMHFLDPEGFLLEPSFMDFRNRWMDEVVFGNPNNPNNPRTWKPKKNSFSEVGELVAPLSYRVRIRDHLKDLPERTVLKRVVDMTKPQKKHYEEMKDALATIINDKTVSVQNKLAELMKLRQITGGFIIDHQEEAHGIKPNPKLEMMDQLLNEEIDKEHKVVVFAQYQWEIRTLKQRYKDHGVVTVYGGNKSSENLENIKTFREDPSVRIIILHPKSAAHGITFTMAHYMIFYSISHSSEDNYQAVARIERAGQKNAMFVYYLLCRNSIDEVIYKVIRSKTLNQEKLIDRKDADDEVLNLWRCRNDVSTG